MGCVYILIGESNRQKKLKTYVGKTERTVATRLGEHLQKTSSRFGKNNSKVLLVYFEEWNDKALSWAPILSNSRAEKIMKALWSGRTNPTRHFRRFGLFSWWTKHFGRKLLMKET